MKAHNIYRKNPFDFLLAALLPLLFTVVIVMMVVIGINRTDEATSAEGKRILEESLQRAVVISYAIEGRYPSSIEVIEENFGIHIDKTKFIVHYTIFASNIFPTITVIAI